MKRPWTKEEDAMLVNLVKTYNASNWPSISRYFAGRSAKSCRSRWCNQLSPEVDHSPITLEEHQVIAHAHAKLGNKWSEIAKRLNGRTGIVVKNHWKSALKRRYSALLMNEEFKSSHEAVLGPSGSASNDLTRLSFALPGLGFGDAPEPTMTPITRSSEPVSLELSLVQDDGGLRGGGTVVKEINFFV